MRPAKKPTTKAQMTWKQPMSASFRLDRLPCRQKGRGRRAENRWMPEGPSSWRIRGGAPAGAYPAYFTPLLLRNRKRGNEPVSGVALGRPPSTYFEYAWVVRPSRALDP